MPIKIAFLSRIIDLQHISEYTFNMKKRFFLYPVVFLLTLFLCQSFLILTALIPQERIYENALKSAEYFLETDLFEQCAGNLENCKKDNYADCISTGIAYHYGEGNVYESIITADYNRVAGENVNVSFSRFLQGEAVETESYSRYWHGSAGVIRLLLTVTDIRGIRFLFSIIGILFNVLLVLKLMQKRQKALGIIYTVAFLSVNGLFALGCLEYGFVFLLVPIGGLLLINGKGTENHLKTQLTFLVIGMLAAFFDFLTAETLTFTVPLFLHYIVVYYPRLAVTYSNKKKIEKASFQYFLQNGICWCSGYGGMFLSKWLLAAVVSGKGAWLLAWDSARERMYGDVNVLSDSVRETATLAQRLQGIFVRNLGCLYWGSSTMKVTTVFGITVMIILILLAFVYMFRKSELSMSGLVIPIMLGMIPYLRFLLLSNHTYIHYFFTYRAQMVTVMAVLYILYEITMFSNGRKEKEYGTMTFIKRRRKHEKK